jgi:hypothetical protein
VAAADVRHLGAGSQFGLDAVKGRDPAGYQVGGIAGAEEPLGAGEQVWVVGMPGDSGAVAEGCGDLRFVFDPRS